MSGPCRVVAPRRLGSTSHLRCLARGKGFSSGGLHHSRQKAVYTSRMCCAVRRRPYLCGCCIYIWIHVCVHSNCGGRNTCVYIVQRLKLHIEHDNIRQIIPASWQVVAPENCKSSRRLAISSGSLGICTIVNEVFHCIQVTRLETVNKALHQREKPCTLAWIFFLPSRQAEKRGGEVSSRKKQGALHICVGPDTRLRKSPTFPFLRLHLENLFALGTCLLWIYLLLLSGGENRLAVQCAVQTDVPTLGEILRWPDTSQTFPPARHKTW